ncbi:MAG: hypothetical protein Q9160_004956 [Pyrenula sp. 1 TL-2023]
MKVEGRTFIISGGSSGLGLGIATHILSHGASVSILDLNPPPSTSSLSSLKDNVLFTHTDVSSTSSIAAAVTATVSFIKQIGKPLGGVITCAGISHAERALPKQDPENMENVKAMDLEGFDRTLRINLRGTVDLITQALPHLAAVQPSPPDNDRGVIVVVSSVAAYEGQVGQLAYSASKGAIASMVLPLARELGRSAGIRVCGVAPGVMETAMVVGQKGGMICAEHIRQAAEYAAKPLGERGMLEWPIRMGKPEEFATLVGEIIRNGMLNGTVIRLDGGVRFPSRL